MRELCIVVPALEEGPRIESLLVHLQAARAAGAEVIVVDGGSADDTVARARPLADRVLTSPPGRGRQLALGIAAGARPFLWLLHADSGIDPAHPALVVAALSRPGVAWGRFDVAIEGRSPLLWCVAAAMNLRTRLTGVVTGDHGIFVRRAALEAAGGHPVQPLMEDIELSRRLRTQGWPRALRPPLRTSGRRWERRGVLRTILQMWRFRLRYFLGARPEDLAREYYGG